MIPIKVPFRANKYTGKIPMHIRFELGKTWKHVNADSN